MKYFLFLSFFLLLCHSSVAVASDFTSHRTSNITPQPPSPPIVTEDIIITGGVALHQWEQYKKFPHDHWWANFVRASRNRLASLKAHQKPHEKITWLVFRPSYIRRGRLQEKQDLLSLIRSVQKKYHVHLRFFDTQKELIDYLNYGTPSHPRSQQKIADLEYFGHSNSACFLFDYSNQIDTASKVWLHESELNQIHHDIFTPHPFIKSWGCHTGESMSHSWKKATGYPMIGAIGTTDYSGSDTPGWEPKLGEPHGSWKK